VAENTIYWYRVRAANFYGDSGYSNIDSAATPQRKLGRGKEKILAAGGKKG
jgi:hypothetical protein